MVVQGIDICPGIEQHCPVLTDDCHPEFVREQRHYLPIVTGLGDYVRIDRKPGLEYLLLVPAFAAELEQHYQDSEQCKDTCEINQKLFLVSPLVVHLYDPSINAGV